MQLGSGSPDLLLFVHSDSATGARRAIARASKEHSHERARRPPCRRMAGISPSQCQVKLIGSHGGAEPAPRHVVHKSSPRTVTTMVDVIGHCGGLLSERSCGEVDLAPSGA